MTVRRLLRYYGQLKGRTVAELDPVIDDWMARLGMQGWGEQEDRDAVEGHVAEGAVRRRRHLAPRVADPRRAVFRPRPGQRRVAQGRRARDARPRHHRRLQHARHGHGRTHVRPDLHDLSRPQGARRHARANPGAVRLRHRPPAHRRRRRRPRRHARRAVGQRLRPAAGGPAQRRSAALPARISPRARRSTTSRSPVRRCTTSSCASRGRPRPMAADHP